MKGSRRKFCSTSCGSTFNHKLQYPNYVNPPRNCVECGKPFLPIFSKATQKYCSRKCVGAIGSRRYWTKYREQFGSDSEWVAYAKTNLIQKKCPTCGTLIPWHNFSRYSKQKYCSHRCELQARWANKPRGLTYHSKVCIVCKNTFKTLKPKTTFCCSRKCAGVYRRIDATAICAHCGILFLQKGRGKRRERFCSHKCGTAERWVRFHSKYPPLEHDCLWCGKHFIDKSRPYNPNLRFCSANCAHKYQWSVPNNKTRQATTSRTRRERSRAALLKRRFHIKDTPIELALQNELHKRGIKFVVQIPLIVCQPDIFIPEARLAIFADGCYWHGCIEHRPAGLSAKQRKWVDEDRYKTAFLLRHGYNVLRFWEHDINKDVVVCVDKIVNLIASTVDVTPTNGNLSINPDVPRKPM